MPDVITGEQGLLRDERGGVSSARLLLVFWTGFSAWFLAAHADATPAALSFLGAVDTALICWAGGPRIAQYLAPQVAATASAIGKAVWARRDKDEAIEPTTT